MRCLSCNELMKPYDRTRKSLSGFYVDLCGKCYSTVKDELPAYGNPVYLEADDEETTLFDDSLDSLEDSRYNSNIDYDVNDE